MEHATEFARVACFIAQLSYMWYVMAGGGTSLIMGFDMNNSGADASTNFSSTSQCFFNFAGCWLK